MITGIDHVQLAMPRGREDAARSFYAGLLGMNEVVKPPVLAVRGGCWFVAGGAVVHLGVEEPFTPGHACVCSDGEILACAGSIRTTRSATGWSSSRPDPGRRLS